MARIHRSFPDGPLIAARKLFPDLDDSEIIVKALCLLAQIPEPPSASERQKAGQTAGGKARGKQISQASALHPSGEAETGRRKVENMKHITGIKRAVADWNKFVRCICKLAFFVPAFYKGIATCPHCGGDREIQ